MPFISLLSLTSFRNYSSATIRDLDQDFVILIGDNGAGKTNCLEAVSLLSPGRGLRGATVAEIQSQSPSSSESQGWAVSAEIHDKHGDVTRLGVGRDPQKPNQKLIRADGTTVKNQEELGDILRSIWLTPQMDGLFLQAATERRRFFDRLVAAFDSAHAGRMTRYEKAARERLAILRDDSKTPDPTWLSALENIMAETSVAIAAARIEVMDLLQKTVSMSVIEGFPACILRLDGDVEGSLSTNAALSVEDQVRARLSDFRQADGQTGRTNYGIGRTDFAVIYADKNTKAAQCSTGEQKALLTAIIIAHAQMVEARYGAPPLLLFDEVAAHFDAHRRDALFEILSGLKGQVWLSGQDAQAFTAINHKIMVKVDNNALL